MRRRAGGFTLIELTVVFAVVALLLGALLVPLATQVDNARYEATRSQLEEAREALVAFAIANGNRLPCPDADSGAVSGDGLPDPLQGHAPGGSCTDVEGFLPYAVLGVPRADAWGNPLRYRANSAFTQSTGTPVPPLPVVATSFDVWTLGPPVATDARMLTGSGTEAPAAVIFSCGKNTRADDDNYDGGTGPAGCLSTTATLDARYTADAFIDGTFDDVVVWLSTQALVTRLIEAGTWPPRGR